MNRFPLWKHAVVAVLVAAGALYTLPSIYDKSPTVQIRARTAAASDVDLHKQLTERLAADSIAYEKIDGDGDNTVVVFDSTEAQLQARAVIAQALGDDFVVALNSTTRAPGWLAAIGAAPIALGLDLRGGVYFLLQVDLASAYERRLKGIYDTQETALRNRGAASVELAGETINITCNTPEACARVLAHLEAESERGDVGLLDLPSDAGNTMNIGLSDAAQDEIIDLTMEQNLQTLRNRVDELGVAEPVITRQGNDRIAVQLPGVQDTTQAKAILGRTAALELRGVNESRTNSRALIRRARLGKPPARTELFYMTDGTPLLLDEKIVIEGENITDASPGYDNHNQPAVFISLDGSGANNMKRHTRSRIGQRLAIILRDRDTQEVISAPVVRDELFANFMISGAMNTQEASELALLLRAGALAAPLEIIEERTVGPSLGADNIRSGLNSVYGGFVAIAAFIVFYYAWFGLMSVLALFANVILLSALLGAVGATLTLPGLAGFALTLGMAIDANVLINERVREEVAAGKTPLAAIVAGYQRAFTTITDANITTFIAGVALFTFGEGPVRGFAVVLCFGLLTSMFSAIQVSRSLINLSMERRAVAKLPLGVQVFNFKKVLPLMQWRKVTGSISAFFLAVCIGSLATQGLNLGVDFTGGTLVEVAFKTQPAASQVREAVEKTNIGNAPIQISDDGLVLIKAPTHAADGTALAAQFSDELMQNLREIDADVELRRIEFVGPQVGDELFIAGAAALVLVLLGITAYLSFRFKWRMAIGAIVANFHDVVFILGLFSLFQWEFNLPVLAAVLAILGYSVNESVVIFDRVRENFRAQRKDAATAAHTLNTAIMQTWARTIITHGSTQLAVLSMLFFGGDALYLFALALTIGIFSSIYSSVLIAGPISLRLGLEREDFIIPEGEKADNPEGAVV